MGLSWLGVDSIASEPFLGLYVSHAKPAVMEAHSLRSGLNLRQV